MRQSAHVLTREDFDAKLERARRTARRRGGGGGGGGGGETDGKTLFTEAAQPTACKSCHTLADAARPARPGRTSTRCVPDLSDEEIQQSIEDPDAEDHRRASRPGLMPRLR